MTAATRIPSDEARHADYALRMASLCAGEDVAFEIDRAALPQVTRPLELEDVDGAMLEVAAMSETLAGALLSACRERATDPVAKALFTSILGDEVHHARLGWYYLAWRAPQWSVAEKQRLADRAGQAIFHVEPTVWMEPRRAERRAQGGGGARRPRQRGPAPRASARRSRTRSSRGSTRSASARRTRTASVAAAMVERRRKSDAPSGAAAAFQVLASPPTPRQRAAIRSELAALLRWQRTLRGWPTPRTGLDATPFISIYSAGRTLGCFGSTEGPPAARLSRAFLRAVEDARFGGVDEAMRARLAAQVSYPARVREVAPEDAPDLLELGLEGVVVATRDGRASVVLPHVARDARLDARGFVDLAAQKAGLAGTASLSGAARVWLFDTHDVSARSTEAARATRRDGVDLAARWLARLVDADGAIAFGVDPRTGARATLGDVMHHGRAAVVVAALAEAHPVVTRRS